jgi:hypothetical protein
MHHSMGEKVDASAALTRLDELIAEAVTLRKQIAAAVREKLPPFFPERRQANQPHAHDRRQFD